MPSAQSPPTTRVSTTPPLTKTYVSKPDKTWNSQHAKTCKTCLFGYLTKPNIWFAVRSSQFAVRSAPSMWGAEPSIFLLKYEVKYEGLRARARGFVPIHWGWLTTLQLIGNATWTIDLGDKVHEKRAKRSFSWPYGSRQRMLSFSDSKASKSRGISFELATHTDLQKLVIQRAHWAPSVRTNANPRKTSQNLTFLVRSPHWGTHPPRARTRERELECQHLSTPATWKNLRLLLAKTHITKRESKK